jgi:hypothetical protein
MRTRNGLVSTLVVGLICLVFVHQGGVAAQWPAADPQAAQTFDCSSVTQIPHAECEALVALYQSTDGSGWTEQGDWLANSAPCSWRGVSCEGGRVTRLILISNALSGTIPSSLGDLSQLQWLQLSSNQLTGDIPAALGNLGALRTLYLYNNPLEGTIPAELGNLTALLNLDLSQTHLQGTTPAALGNLTNLEYLDLSAARLSGSLPDTLGNLRQLQTLNIENNAFAGEVPSSITQLINLGVESWTRVALGYNMLRTSDAEVRAFLDAKDPAWESTQTVPPQGLLAIDASRTTVSLAWAPILYTADGGFYEVHYASIAGGPYQLHGVTDDKAADGYVALMLNVGETYYWVVRSYTPPHGMQANTLFSEFTVEMSATTLLDTPIAGLVASNDGPAMVGDPVQLDASMTQGTRVSFRWDLDDGASAEGPQVTHIYQKPGVYRAVVTASNGAGSVTATTTVIIRGNLYLPMVFRKRS